ncbi:hypothetical protein FIBSPDRAFT_969130 [Athelia psychrophila]|uniref:Uncharacterized protein n=1 Tax=Athelia psychrophila TaxID=1759441 RepID=A0A167TUJ6_9AGAM|nr:hypothetical protein FIBSPDRAFT_969130 [Fibularhizoctonia sp. CBS 109695]
MTAGKTRTPFRQAVRPNEATFPVPFSLHLRHNLAENFGLLDLAAWFRRHIQGAAATVRHSPHCTFNARLQRPHAVSLYGRSNYHRHSRSFALARTAPFIHGSSDHTWIAFTRSQLLRAKQAAVTVQLSPHGTFDPRLQRPHVDSLYEVSSYHMQKGLQRQCGIAHTAPLGRGSSGPLWIAITGGSAIACRGGCNGGAA